MNGPTATSRGFLRALGIAGWHALEPAVLAALATESPLLLVGGHGSAKTLLLARLDEALGLAFPITMPPSSASKRSRDAACSAHRPARARSPRGRS
jgi:hypothetical protein